MTFKKLSTLEIKADKRFENYDFGEKIKVLAFNSWDTSDSFNFSRIVFVEYENSEEDSDSSKVSFHVTFDKNENVQEAYAYDYDTGVEL